MKKSEWVQLELPFPNEPKRDETTQQSMKVYQPVKVAKTISESNLDDWDPQF